MKKNLFALLPVCMILFFLTGCKSGNVFQSSPGETVSGSFPKFLIEGHRGASSVRPENTIPSVIKAIEDGANVIEIDVHISKDNQVVVTHDSKLNRSITLTPEGEEIAEGDSENYIIYKMNYSDIKKYDVGTKFYRRFPEKESMKAYIPLLGELIDSVERFTAENKYPPVIYNIEVKVTPGQDGNYQPAAPEFTDLVMEVVKQKKLGYNRFYLQSFDLPLLREVNRKYPLVVTGFLTGNRDISLEENLSQLGFSPQIYSPNSGLVTPELIAKTHAAGMKFVPWTVNEKQDMEKFIKMGVDGIITDYPERLKQVLQSLD